MQLKEINKYLKVRAKNPRFRLERVDPENKVRLFLSVIGDKRTEPYNVDGNELFYGRLVGVSAVIAHLFPKIREPRKMLGQLVKAFERRGECIFELEPVASAFNRLIANTKPPYLPSSLISARNRYLQKILEYGPAEVEHEFRRQPRAWDSMLPKGIPIPSLIRFLENPRRGESLRKSAACAIAVRGLSRTSFERLLEILKSPKTDEDGKAFAAYALTAHPRFLREKIEDGTLVSELSIRELCAMVHGLNEHEGKPTRASAQGTLALLRKKALETL